jgi:hypothetical protein
MHISPFGYFLSFFVYAPVYGTGFIFSTPAYEAVLRFFRLSASLLYTEAVPDFSTFQQAARDVLRHALSLITQARSFPPNKRGASQTFV